MLKFFILLFIGQCCYGQTITRGKIIIEIGSFQGDLVNKSPNTLFNKLIKLPQIDKSPANVDVRLYTYHSLSNTKSVRRIYLMDTVWRGTEFDEENNPKKIKNYKLSAELTYDSLLMKLLSLNILKLPSQSELEGKMKKIFEVTPDGDTTYSKREVIDGNGYTIEIKIGNKYHLFEFDSPGSYSEFYSDVIELKDYLNIVQTFERNLKREK